MPNLKTVKIVPAIGIARIGNSPEWYLGPELPFPATPPAPPDGQYKDFECRIRRQAQRFRLWGFFDDNSDREFDARGRNDPMDGAPRQRKSGELRRTGRVDRSRTAHAQRCERQRFVRQRYVHVRGRGSRSSTRRRIYRCRWSPDRRRRLRLQQHADRQ